MVRKQRLAGLALASAALGALMTLPAAAKADVFDPSDDGIATKNELVHRGEQVHDLAARVSQADVDWYRISERPFSSYEVVVDQTSADIGPVVLQLVESDGVSVVATSEAVSSLGFSRALRWEWQFVPGQTPAGHERYIRVRSGGCTTTCDASAVYRIRVFETTFTIPRFYDNGTTFTNFVFQNPTDRPMTIHIYYWNAPDAHLIEAANETYSIAPFSLKIVPPHPVLMTPGHAGHLTITSTGGYGGLRGKASQYDSNPVQPQAWDHPMLLRP